MTLGRRVFKTLHKVNLKKSNDFKDELRKVITVKKTFPKYDELQGHIRKAKEKPRYGNGKKKHNAEKEKRQTRARKGL